MSVIFGVSLPASSIIHDDSLRRLASVTTRYGMDGTCVLAQGRVGMGFQAFQTHARARLESQPTVDGLGGILVFDGRLDNYQELAAREGVNENNVSDSTLVLKAYARWGRDCFSRLIGDWALALWSSREQILYLARDHAGSRNLFYRNVGGEVRWSTYLETFFVEDTFSELDEEYLARALSATEIGELTPYKGIRNVPPAHYVMVRGEQATIRAHWRCTDKAVIVYRSDADYDEHFLHLFRQAVQRRIQPAARVLAELSGGMDSSAIVCMADSIARDGEDCLNLVDTISYFDDTEPDWDERPYFAAVEKHRGRKGIHLDCSSRNPSYEPLVLPDRIYPYPGTDRNSLEIARQFAQAVGAGNYRVILSGIGGDELLGGIPTPMPELANYLRAGSVLKLLARASEWCLVGRQSLFQMLSDTVAYTMNLYRPSRAPHNTIPPWLSPNLREMCLACQSEEGSTNYLSATSPSAIANGRAWKALLETLPNSTPSLLGCYEFRYPFLDRDLVEFLHRVPREQLVRPGRRRFMMRRALRGIVPTEIIERKRKAFMSHGPITSLRNGQREIEELFAAPLMAEHRLIDTKQLLLAFGAELAGELKWISPLMKAIGVELWLQGLKASGVSFRVAPYVGNVNQARPRPLGAHKLRADSVES